MLLALCLALAPQNFPAILWRAAPAPSELQRAFGAVCVGRNDSVEALGEAGLEFLVFNAPGRDELHLERERKGWSERRKRWIESRDPELCRREPCLADPATAALLLRRLEESLAARGGTSGLGLSLGDEVGFTPGGVPEDTCTCEHCELAWSLAHAAETAPRPARLRDIGTDATLRAVFDGDMSPTARWLERRAFHQQQLLDLLGTLAARVRAANQPVGLLGLTSQSAFGGVAIERILPQLDFLECYRIGNARELAFTLRRPEQRVYLTVFASQGASGAAWSVWEHWMHGGDGMFVWSEAELASAPQVATRLQQTLARVRALPRLRPRPQGIAIAHSGRSVAAGWLRDALLDGSTWPQRFASWQEQHGSVERARARWFDFARCAGAMPGALPIESLTPADAERFPLLVLAELLVLSPEDLARLEAYRAAGGTLVVDGELGWIDAEGRALAGAARERLERSAKLVEPPSGLRERWSGQPPTQEQLQWLTSLGVPLAPLRPRIEAGESPWLVTWSTSGTATLLAALPTDPSGPERRLNFDSLEHHEVRWLHPSDAHGWSASLPSGEGALVELVRKP